MSAVELAFLAKNASGTALKEKLVGKTISELDLNNLSDQELKAVVAISSHVEDPVLKKELLDKSYEATEAYGFEHMETPKSKLSWIAKRLISSASEPLTTYEKEYQFLRMMLRIILAI